MKMKKSIALALALTMLATATSCSMSQGNTSGGSNSGDTSAKEEEFVYDPNDQYPCTVVYRDGDPQPDLDVEITSTDKITWTVACCLVEDNPQSKAMALIGEELAERTNGNFTLDIFYNSELGSENEAVELTRNNTVQFVTSNVTNMPTYVETFGVFALPYLFHSELDELTYLTTSDIASDLYKQLEDASGLVTLGFNCTGSRCLSTKGVPQISSPDELRAKGVKVRSMEPKVWQDVITSLGATPVPVAYTELYTALQTGVVQGQDNPVANTVDGKFYEVLDTYYRTDHCYLVSGYYTNADSWNALPDDYKALFLGLLDKYQGNYYHEKILDFQKESEQIMIDAGVTFVEQSDLDMDAFYESANEMVEANYMSDPAYASIIEDIRTTFGY